MEDSSESCEVSARVVSARESDVPKLLARRCLPKRDLEELADFEGAAVGCSMGAGVRGRGGGWLGKGGAGRGDWKEKGIVGSEALLRRRGLEIFFARVRLEVVGLADRGPDDCWDIEAS